MTLAIAGGVAIRLSDLDAQPFWVDEAESSINALTILQHGYPTDTYLGLPIFENTLVAPWPESPEYEFRDISYSDRHVAVYHGWLPLYAIAASFAIYHIKPDSPDPVRSVKHDLKEQKRRTVAARMPAVLFGAGLLVVAFVGANLLYGRDAAWAALILGSIHPYLIGLSREARYYSAQLLLTTACCVLVWLMIRRGGWRHFVLAGLLFVLLFHTHLLSFVTALGMVALAAPLIVRDGKRPIAKLAAFGLIVAGGTIPWLILTGFLTHHALIPRAWALLRLPSDLTQFPPFRLTPLLLGAVFAAAIAWAMLAGRHSSSRLKKPLLDSAPSLALVTVWIGFGYAAFLVLMPAASFEAGRLKLSYWGPALLGASVVCAASARMILARRSSLVAVALGLGLFFVTGHSLDFRIQQDPARRWTNLGKVVDQLDAMRLQEDTKIYAAPNFHLVWMVYTGLPVQSIAPVRRQFLNTYRGDVVYIDSPVSIGSDVLSREHIEEAALREGYSAAGDVAGQWLSLLRTRQYRQTMLNDVGADARGQLESLPRFGEALLIASRQRASAALAHSGMRLLMRGFQVDSWSDWRAVFEYRFADPELRSGVKSNYSERLRGAEGLILTEADTVIYRSRWHASERREGIHFRFLPEIRGAVRP